MGFCMVWDVQKFPLLQCNENAKYNPIGSKTKICMTSSAWCIVGSNRWCYFVRSSFHYHLVLRPNFFTSFDISSTDVLRTHLLYYKNAYVQKTRPTHHFYIWWLSDQEFDESQKLHAQKIFLLYSTCMFWLFWLHCSYHCLQTIKILGEITPMKHHQFIYSGLWTR